MVYASVLVVAHHQVDVLNALCGRSLEQVVQSGRHHTSASFFVDVEAPNSKVVLGRVGTNFRDLIRNLYQRLVRVICLEPVDEHLLAGSFCEGCVEGEGCGEGDSAKPGCHMRHEAEAVHVELVTHLALVDMLLQAIGHEVVADLIEVVLAGGRRARSTEAAHSEHRYVASLLQQRLHRQQSALHTRRVASRVGHTCGLLQEVPGTMALRQPIGPGGIKAIVSTQVDHFGFAVRLIQSRYERFGQVIGQSQYPHVHFGVCPNLLRLEVRELQVCPLAVCTYSCH